jgi:hypothetical protein
MNDQAIGPRRRGFLGHVAGAVPVIAGIIALPALASYAEPDAALIALAREYLTLDEILQRINAQSRDGDDFSEEFVDQTCRRSNRALDEVIDMPAHTPAGIRAKAEVLATAIRANVQSGDPEHFLAISLASDLLGRDLSEYVA